ncbi:hypothetical protein PCH_Pc24g00490 [Penicillium rubens Wisconsin 54-1255]|uniref:Uncharacterized protein n=1 Tax=Penicillium rubens (strain ATCC 28089 / DSM 1075 / NRRL 1951 / Wisconsin 54-1255) TaxID=500485 RepID=B6HWL1_PENRW|nr:hypothetical protein PCH_Pc24g00490 [Penicillium rubens Wisconsin 54-1255]
MPMHLLRQISIPKAFRRLKWVNLVTSHPESKELHRQGDYWLTAKLTIIPVLICIVIVTSKLKAPRRVRCESSRSDLINRSPSTPASYRRSRRKTLSRTDLDEIPIYRTGDFPGSRKRGGTPDVERGITCQQTSSSPDLADQNLTLSRLDSSVSGSKIKNEGANSGYTPLPAKPLLHHNTG